MEYFCEDCKLPTENSKYQITAEIVIKALKTTGNWEYCYKGVIPKKRTYIVYLRGVKLPYDNPKLQMTAYMVGNCYQNLRNTVSH